MNNLEFNRKTYRLIQCTLMGFHFAWIEKKKPGYIVTLNSDDYPIFAYTLKDAKLECSKADKS
jgi:hypothetical protein